MKNPRRLKLGEKSAQVIGERGPVVYSPVEKKEDKWIELKRPGVVIKSTRSNRENL